MRKRCASAGLIAGFAAVLAAGACLAMAPAKTPRTLLVIPSRHSVMQIAFDLLGRRDVVLVSYSPAAAGEEPLMHVWNGRTWLRISPADYRIGAFVRPQPPRAILVGGASYAPAGLSDIESWCPDVTRVPDMQTTELLNAFGRAFRFSPAEWRWFASRYNRALEDLNSEKRTVWYDKSREDFFSGGRPVVEPADRATPPPRAERSIEPDDEWVMPPAELILPGADESDPDAFLVP
jgi:hypothetical protein